MVNFFLQSYTMTLHRPWIIVSDAGFEPGTAASERIPNQEIDFTHLLKITK